MATNNWEFSQARKGGRGRGRPTKIIALERDGPEPAPPDAVGNAAGGGGGPALPLSVKLDSLEIENGIDRLS